MRGRRGRRRPEVQLSSIAGITWIGEFLSSPVRLISLRLVPKVASPNRSTFCIAPARSPVTLNGNPKSKPPYPATEIQEIARNLAEGRNTPAILAPLVDNDALDYPVSGLIVGRQCLVW